MIPSTQLPDMIPPTQLISLKYLKLYGVSLDEKGEILYIVSVLKSAYNLVELDIDEVTMNTLCFLSLSFYCHILTLNFYNLDILRL
jgi:hypothetical protein